MEVGLSVKPAVMVGLAQAATVGYGCQPPPPVEPPADPEVPAPVLPPELEEPAAPDVPLVPLEAEPVEPVEPLDPVLPPLVGLAPLELPLVPPGVGELQPVERQASAKGTTKVERSARQGRFMHAGSSREVWVSTTRGGPEG
jgi:hypothetical protein